MRGLGTIINALAILVGGVLGILFKRFLKERYQDTIIKATGFSVVCLGSGGNALQDAGRRAGRDFEHRRLHGHDSVAGAGGAAGRTH